MNEKELIESFSKHLIMLRREKDLMQKEIAKKLEISESTYANWEQGRRTPNIWYLTKLKDVFEIDMNTLFEFLYSK